MATKEQGVIFRVKGYDPAFPDGSPPLDKAVGNAPSPAGYIKGTMEEWKTASANKLSPPPASVAPPTLDEIKASLNLPDPPTYEIPEIYTPEPVELPPFPTKASFVATGVSNSPSVPLV